MPNPTATGHIQLQHQMQQQYEIQQQYRSHTYQNQSQYHQPSHLQQHMIQPPIITACPADAYMEPQVATATFIQPYYVAEPVTGTITVKSEEYASRDICLQLFPPSTAVTVKAVPRIPYPASQAINVVESSSSWSDSSDSYEGSMDMPPRTYVEPASAKARLPTPTQQHYMSNLVHSSNHCSISSSTAASNANHRTLQRMPTHPGRHQIPQQHVIATQPIQVAITTRGSKRCRQDAQVVNPINTVMPGSSRQHLSPQRRVAEVIDLTLDDTPEPINKRRRVDTKDVARPMLLTPVSAKASSTVPKELEYHQDDENGYLIIKINDNIHNGRYKILKIRGQGTFGRVVEAWDRQRRQHVAIKIIRSQPKFKNAARGEVKILKHILATDPLNRKRCIHLLEDFFIGEHTCMVFNLLGGSLYDCMRASRFSPFAISQIRHLARQILEATAFLHSEGITHTDLKPENLMLDNKEFELQAISRRNEATQIVLKDTKLTVIDMGSAVFESDYHSSVVATRHYRAPEIVLGIGWTYPCDIFAIGCILAELFTGSVLIPTVDETTPEEHLYMLEVILGKFPSRIMHDASQFFPRGRVDYPKLDTRRERYLDVKSLPKLEKALRPRDQAERQLLDLVRKMLDLDPAARPTAVEALRHPFLC
ncbi:hypothetical protein SeMB42_g04295 [Synchytrium endobioticum]|nr:hypothetical protein SeMB42_g04295 [Synchytrium endobioticum]